MEINKKRFGKWFSGLSKAKKAQFISAAVLTLALAVILPVYAWFSYTNNLETLTKVKEPDALDIKAGNYDPVVYFDLRNISIEDIVDKNTPEYRVFSVSAGDYKIPYHLQLAHTTNIPLKYEIYQLTDLKNPQPISDATGTEGTTIATVSDGVTTVIYNSPLDSKAYSYSYSEKDKKELRELNVDGNSQNNYGRKTADYNDAYYSQTYLDLDGDDPELYSVPIYLQTEDPIRTNNESDEHDYFVLKLSYDSEAADKAGFTDWNQARDNKETDIIYITAERASN